VRCRELAARKKKVKLLQLPVPGIEPGRVILRAGFVAVFKIILRRKIKLGCALRLYQKPFSR
jgi:hypothetical protein